MLTQSSFSQATPTIVFAGGASGGHLYPALAVAEALRERAPGARFVFFGTKRPIERRILGGIAGCEFVSQTLPMISRMPWRWPGVLWGYHRVSSACRSRFSDDRPALVIGTGGLAAVPVIRAAVSAGIPTALFNPDALPGRANRHLAPLVDLVFVQWEDAMGHFPPDVRVEALGCPIRLEFNDAQRSEGIERFDLDPNLRTLLITGASQGAQSVNQAVVAILGWLEGVSGWQILHLTGDGDYETVRVAYAGRRMRATVRAYTDDMAAALGASDLVITRAGASTLAEITAVGRAAVLMPYPFHKDQHQMANARCLVRASAARILRDEVDPAINGPALRAILEPLMVDHSGREAMAAAARRLGRGNAAARVAERLMNLIHEGNASCRFKTVEATC